MFVVRGMHWLHSTWMSIKTVELEFGSSNPNHARFFRGRMDLPVTYDGTPTANTWTSIGNGFIWPPTNTMATSSGSVWCLRIPPPAEHARSVSGRQMARFFSRTIWVTPGQAAG